MTETDSVNFDLRVEVTDTYHSETFNDEHSITVTSPPNPITGVDIDGPLDREPGQNGTYFVDSVTPSEREDYHVTYQWWKRVLGPQESYPWVLQTGETGKTFTTNAYYDFEVKVVVTDTDRQTEHTSNILYVTVE